MIDTIPGLAQYGAIGLLLIMTWRLMVKKDKKSYELISEQNKERKEMYESLLELVKEVSQALTDKNNTDDAISQALDKLTEELTQRKRQRKGNK